MQGGPGRVTQGCHGEEGREHGLDVALQERQEDGVGPGLR